MVPPGAEKTLLRHLLAGVSKTPSYSKVFSQNWHIRNVRFLPFSACKSEISVLPNEGILPEVENDEKTREDDEKSDEKVDIWTTFTHSWTPFGHF